MTVTIPAGIVQEEEQKAAEQLAGRMRMKGFRKGRVPKSMVQSRFGGALRKETLDRLISESYRAALGLEQLRPISEGEVEEVVYEPGQDVIFHIAFDVQPQLEVSRLGGFAVERPVAEVTDQHVDDVIGRIQEQHGVWEPREDGPAVEKNLVTVKVRRIDEGAEDAEPRDYDFMLGQGDALPDIEEAIKTLPIGGTGEFDVAFPEDFPDESRRGESERVEISLVGRKELVLPELDDDFAKQVGEFDDMSTLRTRVREDLEKDATEQSESVVRGRLLDFLCEANPFDVPVSMVDRYAESVLGDQPNLDPEKKEEVMTTLRPEAERAVKRFLLVDKVAQTQQLEASEDELDERIEEIAGKNDTDPAKIYAELQKAGRLEALEREITEAKVFDFLKSQSEITDAQAS
jgi:trigger factor